MKIEMLLLLLCLCLAVENSAAQCQPATLLPSEVAPSVADDFFTAQLAKPIGDLNQTVASYLQAERGDVFSVAVVYRNSTIFTSGLVDTPFRIGSVTKAFVSVGALLVRQQGGLTLDDPVKKHLPGFSIINPYNDPHDITLRELMAHTAGLPRNLCAYLFCSEEVTEELALASIAKMQLARPIWSNIPVYSSIGFSLLGHAWEKATSSNQTWNQYLRSELLTPLQMRDTGVPADLAPSVQLAPGDMYGFPLNLSLGWQGPTGDMYSTASDLAKFLKFLLHPDETLLSETAIRESVHPTTLFPEGTGYALAWELFPVNNKSSTLITKSGILGSYYSIIAFHPESELGVTVLTSDVTNTTEPATGTALALKIMANLIPQVQAVNANFMSSLYGGTYTCNRTEPVIVTQLGIYEVQVLGGNITVTTMTPDKNLVLNYNVSILQNGTETILEGSRSLVLKPDGAGQNSTTFWSSPGPCLVVSSDISYDPDLYRPHYPGSVNYYEFTFQGSLLRWPALGGMCHKA